MHHSQGVLLLPNVWASGRARDQDPPPALLFYFSAAFAAAWLAACAAQAALWHPGCCCGSRLSRGILLLLLPPYVWIRLVGRQAAEQQSYLTSRLQRMFMAASSLTRYLKT
jgi:hypothetical protein